MKLPANGHLHFGPGSILKILKAFFPVGFLMNSACQPSLLLPSLGGLKDLLGLACRSWFQLVIIRSISQGGREALCAGLTAVSMLGSRAVD